MPSRERRGRALAQRRAERDRVAGRYGQLVADVLPAAHPGAGADHGAERDELATSNADEVGDAGVDQRLVLWRRRAERAEAEEAELRRESARLVLRLRGEVAFWRALAGGLSPAEAEMAAVAEVERLGGPAAGLHRRREC